MSNPRLSSQERRAAIIRAAIELFAEKGFRGTTTRELASAVGVSEPVLYQHFTTKRDLYNAILEEMALSSQSVIPDCLPPPSVSADDVRPFLTGLAQSIITWHKTNPNFIRLLLLSALENHEFNQLFYERYVTSFFAGLRGYFEAGMQNGLFRQQDPALPTLAFISLVGHYSMELAVFHKTNPAHTLSEAQTIDGFVDMFLKGIEACSAQHTYSPSAYSFS